MRKVKLWQLWVAILVVAVALALIPSQGVAVMAVLFIEAVLLISFAVLLVLDFRKRRRRT
jgi:hypothetical protein